MTRTRPTAGPEDGRPLDALLADYAAGALPRPLHVLVAAHLALCPDNRAFVAALESLAGEQLDGAPPVALGNREAGLAAVFADGPAREARRLPPCRLFPPVLVDFFGHGAEVIAWRRLLPGLGAVAVPCPEGVEASLLNARPGAVLPRHTHEGVEATLVLDGAFRDSTGIYRRGDIAVADEDLDHRPVADGHEGCLCFVVSAAPPRLTGPIGRLARRLLGR